jgi:hypothetical protein
VISLIRETKKFLGSLRDEAEYSTTMERKSVRTRLDGISDNLSQLEKAQNYLKLFLDVDNLSQLITAVDGNGNKKQLKLAIKKIRRRGFRKQLKYCTIGRLSRQKR